MVKPDEKIPDASRAHLKRRIHTLLEEFPREVELGTFRTEYLFIRLGHMLRELGRTLDKTRAESIIYGPDQTTLKELGDAYWEIGIALETKRPRNKRRTPHADSISEIERSGL